MSVLDEYRQRFADEMAYRLVPTMRFTATYMDSVIPTRCYRFRLVYDTVPDDCVPLDAGQWVIFEPGAIDAMFIRFGEGWVDVSANRFADRQELGVRSMTRPTQHELTGRNANEPAPPTPESR